MKQFTLLILIGFYSSLSAQTNIDFGMVDEVTSKTLNADYNLVQNYQGDSVTIYFKLMGKKPYQGFSLKHDSLRVLSQQGTLVRAEIEFSPSQNMQHHALLTVETAHEVLAEFNLEGQGIFSNSYYSSTRNKDASQLKTSIVALLGNGYKSLGYTKARDEMYADIDNRGGQIECVYTGSTAVFNTRAGANSAGFNCEHTFPQGMFSQNEPMRSDIHHLFPTTVSSNSRRGNDPFGVVSNPSWQDGGSKSGSSTFEPRDAQKGATARAMSYFILRYQDYNGFYASQESILRKWMEDFKPAQWEIDRNDDIYAQQNNRNPFVDYPQFLDRLSSISGTPVSKKYFSLNWNRAIEQHNNNDTIYGYRFDNLLYNDGSEALTIDSMYFKNATTPLNIQSLSSNNLPSGGTVEFELAFSVVGEGHLPFNDSLIIEYSGDGAMRASIPFAGVAATGSSIRDVNPTANFSIYPNPSSSVLNIDWQGSKALNKLQVVNSSGILVYASSDNVNSIDVSSWETGVYFLILHDEEGKVYQRRFGIE